jgi:hypothetical protein
MKKVILGILLSAVSVSSVPAIAKHDRGSAHGQRNDDRHDRADRQGHNSDDRRGDNGRHRGQQKRSAWQDYNRYDYNRPDPRYGNYRADRYYRDGSYYQDRRLYNQDRIYRGSNNQYYCRRSDGTTGLIIGAVGGGLLGRAIAPNGSKTLGTILGGAGGALIGRSIGRNGVRCN